MSTITYATPWKKVELYGANNDGGVRRFTCVDDAQISKGLLLSLHDDRVASKAIASSRVFAGVTSMEKEANDGSTSISAWTDGVFEVVSSGAINAGSPIAGAEYSAVVAAQNLASGANVIGYALETSTDLEVINVRLKL